MERADINLEKVIDVQGAFIQVGVNHRNKGRVGLKTDGKISPEHMAADQWIRANLDNPEMMTPVTRSRLVGMLVSTKLLTPKDNGTKVSTEEICAALDKVIEIGKKP